MCVYVYTYCLTFLQTEVLSILRWRDATWRKAGSKMNGHLILCVQHPRQPMWKDTYDHQSANLRYDTNQKPEPDHFGRSFPSLCIANAPQTERFENGSSALPSTIVFGFVPHDRVVDFQHQSFKRCKMFPTRQLVETGCSVCHAKGQAPPVISTSCRNE